MGLAGGDAGSAYFEQPVSASGVRGTRCDGERNRVARDFSVSRLPQSFLLDDFARRTSENRALNKLLRRSFPRSGFPVPCARGAIDWPLLGTPPSSPDPFSRHGREMGRWYWGKSFDMVCIRLCHSRFGG